MSTRSRDAVMIGAAAVTYRASRRWPNISTMHHSPNGAGPDSSVAVIALSLGVGQAERHAAGRQHRDLRRRRDLNERHVIAGRVDLPRAADEQRRLAGE